LNTHSPQTNDTLTATATSADQDSGDSVTLTYVWKVNGVTMKTTGPTTVKTDTFNLSQAGNGNVGDTVTVTVTPNDGKVDGTPVTDTATVANPVRTASVLLSSTRPQTDDTLQATATTADNDGDPVTVTYVWQVNGQTVKTTPSTSQTTDSLDLSQSGN